MQLHLLPLLPFTDPRMEELFTTLVACVHRLHVSVVSMPVPLPPAQESFAVELLTDLLADTLELAELVSRIEVRP